VPGNPDTTSVPPIAKHITEARGAPKACREQILKRVTRNHLSSHGSVLKPQRSGVAQVVEAKVTSVETRTEVGDSKHPWHAPGLLTVSGENSQRYSMVQYDNKK
jgi:hypothetical protein